MSRGFWAAIGGIAGFFVAGNVGMGIARAIAHAYALSPGGVAELVGDYGAIASIVGIPCGFAIAWVIAGKHRRQ